MSKINRYNGDLRAFAADALANERTVFGGTAESDDLTDQITTEFLRGWGIVASNEFPTLQDFSAAFFTATQLLSYLHQMGVAEWNAGQEYPTEGALTVHNGRNWKRAATWVLGDEPGVSSSWSAIGGATGGGGDAVFYENDKNVTTDYTITTGKNAMSAGAITIDSGATVTVPTGSTWTVV